MIPANTEPDSQLFLLKFCTSVSSLLSLETGQACNTNEIRSSKPSPYISLWMPSKVFHCVLRVSAFPLKFNYSCLTELAPALLCFKNWKLLQGITEKIPSPYCPWREHWKVAGSILSSRLIDFHPIVSVHGCWMYSKTSQLLSTIQTFLLDL